MSICAPYDQQTTRRLARAERAILEHLQHGGTAPHHQIEADVMVSEQLDQPTVQAAIKTLVQGNLVHDTNATLRLVQTNSTKVVVAIQADPDTFKAVGAAETLKKNGIRLKYAHALVNELAAGNILEVDLYNTARVDLVRKNLKDVGINLLSIVNSRNAHAV